MAVEMAALREGCAKAIDRLFRNLRIEIAPAGGEGDDQLPRVGPVIESLDDGRRHAVKTPGSDGSCPRWPANLPPATRATCPAPSSSIALSPPPTPSTSLAMSTMRCG